MTFRCWLKRPPMAVPSRRRCRPFVEALAERLVPSFIPAPPVPVGDGPNFVAVGDFNGDGKRDLAVANSFGTTVSIRLGGGQGGFAPLADVAVGGNPEAVAVADFNRDGHQDLAVAV